MRFSPIIPAIAVALSCLAFPRIASSQTIGTLIGANISTISDADKGIGEAIGGAFNKKKRIGLKVGAYLKIPLAGMVSLEPEAFYAQNGVRIETSASGIDALDVDLGYVEIPVLLRLDIGAKKAIHPILLAGGSGAWRVQCKLGASSSASTIKQDCNANGGADDPFKKSDYSAVGGAGFAANLGGLAASLQIRYSHGLSNIATDENDVAKPKNRAVSVLLGFTF